MASIFLSYARNDDEAFVRRLHADLTNAGFDVWFDRVFMPSRQLTFHQEIPDAIAVLDRLLLVVGPGVLTSDYVTQEWRFADFEAGKCVDPIVRLNGRKARIWLADKTLAVSVSMVAVNCCTETREPTIELQPERIGGRACI